MLIRWRSLRVQVGNGKMTKNEITPDRALPMLKLSVGEGVSHPAVSQQNQIVREQILGFLRMWLRVVAIP